MTLLEYVDAYPPYQEAQAALQKAHLDLGGRWGEARRFAGRSAGLRLERLDKARERCSREFDKASAKYKKEFATA